MTIRRMRIAWWVLTATNTHSDYLMLIVLPLQKWLHERTSMSRYTDIACLVTVIVLCPYNVIPEFVFGLSDCFYGTVTPVSKSMHRQYKTIQLLYITTFFVSYRPDDGSLYMNRNMLQYNFTTCKEL